MSARVYFMKRVKDCKDVSVIEVNSVIILWLLKLGITRLSHNKDDIQFVTEFPCFFGTPCIKNKPTQDWLCLCG